MKTIKMYIEHWYLTLKRELEIKVKNFGAEICATKIMEVLEVPEDTHISFVSFVNGTMEIYFTTYTDVLEGISFEYCLSIAESKHTALGIVTTLYRTGTTLTTETKVVTESYQSRIPLDYFARKYVCYEENYEYRGSRQSIDELSDHYTTEIHKDTYPDFDCWLHDMLESGLFVIEQSY